MSIGPKKSEETLRTALAMGADRGIHIVTDERTDQTVQPLAVSKVFAHFAKKENADLVILGKQAIDGDNCQTAPMTAALLGWAQCTFACGLKIENGSVSLYFCLQINSSFIISHCISPSLRIRSPPTVKPILEQRKYLSNYQP